MKLKLPLIISILMVLISCSGENTTNQAVEMNESTSVERDILFLLKRYCQAVLP